jgi:methionyl-tRNA synthetase
MQNKKYNRYTITSALPYANGPLHIGHIAGAYLPADIYVRYLRLQKKDVLYVCGSDEHGAAITLRAKKEGIVPQQIIDKYHMMNKKAFEDFGISFDIYHRTSSKIHHETAQDIFTKLYEKGEFEEKVSEQFFDVEFQQFLADRYIIGTCPKCAYENAYGDQCEKCGSALSPEELINPRSTLSNGTPEMRTTKHWYLPMGKYDNWLKEWINEGKKGIWKTNVYGQCKSWIDGGLHSRSMTRDLDWGIKVPLKDADGKVLYVWLDAPIGYISATKQWAKDNNKNWEDYWKKDDTRLLHFIGKDNIVFHCIIFPIILKAHGEFILPDNVPANEFLNLEGDKLSTSRNWAVWLPDYLEDFPEKQDALRYVLTSIAPETKDSEFTWKDYQNRNNNELVNTLGNFINRVLVLTNKYFDGQIKPKGTLEAIDEQVFVDLLTQKSNIEQSIEKFRFKEAQQEVMEIARIGDRYLTATEPWKLFKTNPERVETILNVAIQIVGNLAALFKPFLPKAMADLEKMLQVETLAWENAGEKDILKAGHQIGKAQHLFSKIEDSQIDEQMAKLEASKNANKALEPLKDEVTFDEFTKMDIRTATILAAEKVKKTKKLLKIELDTGLDTRTVVSGIAEHYKPEELIGKQVCILANLAPRKIKGIESQGMILMAEDKEGSLKLISPQDAINNGGMIS